MQIDPKITFWIGVWTSILMLVTNGTIHLTNGIPADWIPIVTTWCSNFATINTVLLTALTGYSSNSSGPLVNVPLPPAAKALIVFLVIGLALSIGAPAHAETQLAANAARTKLPFDPLGLNGKPSPNQATTNSVAQINFDQIGQQLQKVAKEAVDKAIADLTAASTDAQNRNDKISKPCWDAQVSFLKLLPVEWETPPTEIGPALAIQISRDLLNTVTGNDEKSLKVSCAALIGDQLNIVNQVLAVVGLGAVKVGSGGLLP